MKKRLPNSSFVYILGALIPYTDPNLKLVFKPNEFFKDLAEISKKKERTLRNQFYILKREGYISYNSGGGVQLTNLGQLELQRFKPKHLGGNAVLMVIFDIYEQDRHKRAQLRMLLRELKFKQAQKSVWISEYESRKYLTSEIRQLGLQDEVQMFEARKLNL